MRLLSLPVTVVRVPFEIGFGAAKQAVKFAHGLVGGGGEEPVAETPRPAPPPRRRRTSTRSGNGRARTGRAGKSRAKRTPTATPPPPATAAPPVPAPDTPVEPVAEPVPAPPAADASAVVPAPPSPTVASEPSAVDAPAVVAEPSTTADAPTHVSEEPELVAEAAETGAEEGAGAEVAVDEPWPGYDEMTASDIEDRLVTEGAEAAAAVSLYEASHKGRAAVLEAASRTMTA
jgi:hypothetical protein